MKRIFSVLPILLLIVLFFLTGCSNNTKEKNVTATDHLQDVYQAYGVKKGDIIINEKFIDNPPRIVQLKPIKLQLYPYQVQLDMEPVTIERGKEARFNIFGQDVKGSGKIVINSEIVLKYRGKKDRSGLFSVEHTTDLKRYVVYPDSGDELQLAERTEKTMGAYSIGPNDNGDYALEIALGKESGIGNLGEVMFKITGVQIK
uniref:Lipoprotein n=1 Tax=Caldicellulosiruptor owensensis TaxID=55205 RepID=A0A7C5Z647_9FIRM